MARRHRPRPVATETQAGIIINKATIQMVISILGFFLTIGALLWKGGGLTQQIENLQQQVSHQQTQLDSIDSYFRK